ncbi:MAG: PEP/pyruvate-binding domain-containing protein [Bacteroidales bacterium]|nr:PEP/pyruvate-binding domain-containing protein [Bacteroidales bacterium]
MQEEKNIYLKRFQENSNIINPNQPLAISQEEIRKLLTEKQERLKELGAIHQTTSILKEEKPIEEMLGNIVKILPPAWQHPEATIARIKYGEHVFVSRAGLKNTRWVQRKTFETIDGKEGSIEIFYQQEYPEQDEGPFLIEERHLINNLSSLITGYLNTQIGKNLLKQSSPKEKEPEEIVQQRSHSAMSRHLLQKFLNKHNSDRDIYHDLMQYKVREILLVANLYDAYIIEQEGRFFEQVTGEYYQLNLSSAPRITGVSTPEEALEKLQEKHFDMVIVMMGVEKSTPIQLSRIIKQIYHNIPIFMLLNNNSDIALFEDGKKPITSIDKVFVWNGDSKVFLAMVKYNEDRLNVENDIRIGMVQVILLVEDSAKYYSRYLPILYSIVIEQTQHLIEEVNTDELYKLLKMRVRPKILLASNYSEAVSLFNKYRNNLLCLISDVKFEKDGEMDAEAGLKLVRYAKETVPNLPCVLQSSDRENAEEAYKLQSTFINKNSESLKQDLQSFINYYLGFGHFIYKDETGRRDIAVARSMKEFQTHLRSIPEKSLIYHARKDHFSHWLMARGEIQMAKRIKPLKVEDFESPGSLREYLIDIIEQCIYDKQKGKVINYEESALMDDTNVVSLSPGSLGGKGRGLAFINMIINSFNFNELVPDIRICTPRTSIIGTEEFERFIHNNDLYDAIYNEQNYDNIKQLFLEGNLTVSLRKRLKAYLTIIERPLAIRSSSLFEDSLMQPFAGIFDTFLLPNNHPNLDIRLEQLMNAIKLVYASIFSPMAKSYFKAVNYKIEEEKMAVILQEVVGREYNGAYYPHISGVAQSYNFYPYSYMKPDEGFASIAVGLGKYVVEGEKTYRFSPIHPQLEMYTPKELFKNSQVHFYAVDMKKKELNLLEGEDAGLIKLEIDKAEQHGTLKHCASVYDFNSERTIPGITSAGPRVVNFANILKYDYIPLAKTIEVILDIISESMGTPIETEFAIDLNKDKEGRASFYLLQIKPLIKNIVETDIIIDKIDNERLLLFSENGMGNGRITDLHDIIYVDIDKFDKLKTEKIRDEIEQLNAQMVNENRKYILVGPGRWGTRDRFIGIPVNWSQISNARIIVEMSMEEFPLDASLGSHFFHNVISMNVGYFSVKHNDLIDYINWDVLKDATPVNETRYLRHVRFEKPLEVVMDGKKRNALIYYPDQISESIKE